jgi:hypothetical protein
MNASAKILLGALVFALPAAAFAQSGDTSYCMALSSKYQRYVSTNELHYRTPTPPNDVSVAISQCHSNWASAIPVLERALQAAKLDLPPHG